MSSLPFLNLSLGMLNMYMLEIFKYGTREFERWYRGKRIYIRGKKSQHSDTPWELASFYSWYQSEPYLET